MAIPNVRSDGRVPFLASRNLLRTCDSITGMGLSATIHARPLTHVTPDGNISLSDSQTPGDQLRFYTEQRALRGFRYLGMLLADRMPEGLDIHVDGDLHHADTVFFDQLRKGGLRLEIEYAQPSERRDLDAEGTRFLRTMETISSSEFDIDAVRGEIDRMLAAGDSWTAAEYADAVVRREVEPDSRLGDSIGLAYGLQGRNEEAEAGFRRWSSKGGITAARARYSLAMMYARHHRRDRLDMDEARRHLETAWTILAEQPDSEAVVYERVFNRNGLALLLFRDGDFDEAAGLLEDGIAALSDSPWGGELHHTVLLNNLGRVYAAMGRYDDAEKTLRLATSLDPLFAEYWQDLASFYCDRERYAAAAETAARARDLDPAIPGAHELFGYVREQLGDTDIAVAAYDVAARLGSPSAPLAALRALSADERYPEVTRRLTALETDTLSPDDKIEAAILGIEARSMLDADVDVETELQRLRDAHGPHPLIDENLELVSAS